MHDQLREEEGPIPVSLNLLGQPFYEQKYGILHHIVCLCQELEFYLCTHQFHNQVYSCSFSLIFIIAPRLLQDSFYKFYRLSQLVYQVLPLHMQHLQSTEYSFHSSSSFNRSCIHSNRINWQTRYIYHLPFPCNHHLFYNLSLPTPPFL